VTATIVLWTGVAVLLVALVWLQVAGFRALAGVGAKPSPALRTLRAANVVLVLCVVAFAFWKWVT
jgi:hypothetical protein